MVPSPACQEAQRDEQIPTKLEGALVRFPTGCCSAWALLGCNVELCCRMRVFPRYLQEWGWGLGGVRALVQTLVLPGCWWRFLEQRQTWQQLLPLGTFARSTMKTLVS